jgi:hypothetical protein
MMAPKQTYIGTAPKMNNAGAAMAQFAKRMAE